ncbi:MAG: T9SS type A sorting domain-containing protein [Saprospiraceae bacterium]|nr:T9SS type A sorting domain-containing protein [Candidatus Opimibacter skivensis]
MPVSSETIQLSTSTIDLYPNPCYSCRSFFVRNLPEDNQYTYDIFSSMSTLITSGKIEGNQIMLSTNLPAGIYFVVIHGDGFSAVRRIVVF